MRKAGVRALMGDALAGSAHAHATGNNRHIDDLAQVVICGGRFGDVRDAGDEIHPVINVGWPGGCGLLGRLRR